MMSVKSRFMAGAAAGSLALGGVAVLGAGPAGAAVCGYSTKMESYDSQFSFTIPFFNIPVDPFGGKREVAYYGNCEGSNVSISVSTQTGRDQTLCVTPGETSLGFTQHDRKVTGATKTGSC